MFVHRTIRVRALSFCKWSNVPLEEEFQEDCLARSAKVRSSRESSTTRLRTLIPIARNVFS